MHTSKYLVFIHHHIVNPPYTFHLLAPIPSLLMTTVLFTVSTRVFCVAVWLGLLIYFVCYILNTSEIKQHVFLGLTHCV